MGVEAFNAILYRGGLLAIGSYNIIKAHWFTKGRTE